MKCQDAEREILSLVDHSGCSPEVNAHLARCAACSALLAESEEMDSLLRTAPLLAPNPFLWTRIESRLVQQAAPGRRWWFPRQASAWLTATALVLFSLLIGSFQSQIPVNPEPALVEYGLSLQPAIGINPFLIAQADRVNGTNPFLEAMIPRDLNPFQFQRVP